MMSNNEKNFKDSIPLNLKARFNWTTTDHVNKSIGKILNYFAKGKIKPDEFRSFLYGINVLLGGLKNAKENKIEAELEIVKEMLLDTDSEIIKRKLL